MSYCDRESGMKINPLRGSKQNQSQVYLEGDTGTYEYLRVNIGEMLEDGWGEQVSEAKDEHKTIEVSTDMGSNADVEGNEAKSRLHCPQPSPTPLTHSTPLRLS